MATYGGMTLGQLRQGASVIDHRAQYNDLGGYTYYNVGPDWINWHGSSLAGQSGSYWSAINSVSGESTAGILRDFSAAITAAGYRCLEKVTDGGSSAWRWVENSLGGLAVEPQQVSFKDGAFTLAVLAAAAVVTAGVAGVGAGAGAAGEVAVSAQPATAAIVEPVFGTGIEFGVLTGQAAELSAAGLVGVAGPLTAAPGAGLFGAAAGAGGLIDSAIGVVKDIAAAVAPKVVPKAIGAAASAAAGALVDAITPDAPDRPALPPVGATQASGASNGGPPIWYFVAAGAVLLIAII